VQRDLARLLQILKRGQILEPHRSN
jgi:hypothetical protein